MESACLLLATGRDARSRPCDPRVGCHVHERPRSLCLRAPRATLSTKALPSADTMVAQRAVMVAPDLVAKEEVVPRRRRFGCIVGTQINHGLIGRNRVSSVVAWRGLPCPQPSPVNPSSPPPPPPPTFVVMLSPPSLPKSKSNLKGHPNRNWDLIWLESNSNPSRIGFGNPNERIKFNTWEPNEVLILLY